MSKFDRIVSNPTVLEGQPCIRGQRLTVRRVLEALAIYTDRASIRNLRRRTFGRLWSMLLPILMIVCWS